MYLTMMAEIHARSISQIATSNPTAETFPNIFSFYQQLLV
jgi:hypothetical protein